MVTIGSCDLVHDSQIYQLPYTYKFSRDVNFVDEDFSDFIFVDHLLSHIVLQVYHKI